MLFRVFGIILVIVGVIWLLSGALIGGLLLIGVGVVLYSYGSGRPVV